MAGREKLHPGMMAHHKEQEGNFFCLEPPGIFGNGPMSRQQLLLHTLAEQDGWASGDPEDLLM
jgi:hypothetical protein